MSRRRGRSRRDRAPASCRRRVRGRPNCSRSCWAVATWAGSVTVMLPGPHPGVVGDEPTVETHPDPFQVSGDGDLAADRGRVDGVVVGVDAHVVVAAEPDLVRPADRRWDRRQRQHRCPVSVDEIDRAGLERAHHTPVRPLQPLGELGVEVGRRVEAAAGHERRLEEPVATLDDTLRLRVARLELMDPGGQRPAELGDPSGEAAAAAADAARCPRSTPPAPAQTPRSTTTSPTTDPGSDGSATSARR